MRIRLVHGVFLLASVVFLLSAGTGFPEGGSGETSAAHLEKVRKDIERAKREIEKGEKTILNMRRRSKTVQSEIVLEERRIRQVRENLLRLENEEKSLLREEDAARNRLSNARKVLDFRSTEYRARLRAMYKRQKMSPARALFGAGSVSSIFRGFRMLTALAAADLEMLHSIRRQNDAIQTEMANIQLAIEAKRTLEAAKRRESLVLASSQKKRRQLLDEISRDQKAQEERNRRWEKEYRNAVALMDRLIQEQIERDRKLDSAPVKDYSFSARRGKLPWPVSGEIVSRYGRQVDARTKTVTINRGVEFRTRHGEQVRSIGTGKVVKTQSIRGYGNFVMVFHYPTYYTIYAHLSDILVREGDIVREGMVVGLAGSTGLVDAGESRLLIEVLNGRTPDNPLRWLRPDRRSAGI